MRAISYATTALLIHSWYPPACCADQDCKPVPCASITKTDKEYIWEGYHFPLARVYSSKDGGCHACVTYSFPQCLFIQLST
jgi:hypothetical protein